MAFLVACADEVIPTGVWIDPPPREIPPTQRPVIPAGDSLVYVEVDPNYPYDGTLTVRENGEALLESKSEDAWSPQLPGNYEWVGSLLKMKFPFDGTGWAEFQGDSLRLSVDWVMEFHGYWGGVYRRIH